MQTCFSFVHFTGYLARNMHKIDPDLAPGAPQPKDATAEQWTAFQHQHGRGSAATSSSATASGAADPTDDEVRILTERLARYESTFGRNLQVLLDALNHYAATETVALLNLCARLSTANHGTEYAGLRHEEDLV